MSIKISGYVFEGPYESTELIKDESGVYVILCQKKDNVPTVIDIGESSEIKTRIDNHDRIKCWGDNCSFTICIAVYYTTEIQRMLIEKQLREEYEPPCGKE